MLYNALLISLREIGKNWVTSLLTVLGITIGIASLSIMLNLGISIQKKVKNDITTLGDDTITLIPNRAKDSTGHYIRLGFSYEEVERLRSLLGEGSISALARTMVSLPFKGRRLEASVMGIDENYLKMVNQVVEEGATLSQQAFTYGQKSCLVGQSLAKEGVKLGAILPINSTYCKVIGILEARGTSMYGVDNDNIILLPLSAFIKGVASIKSSFYIRSIIVDRTRMGMGLVRALNVTFNKAYIDDGSMSVDERYDGLGRSRSRHAQESRLDIDGNTRALTPKELGIDVIDVKKILEVVDSSMESMTLLLGIIGVTSLVVGGIGIMNIMLTSIARRTKEIGIRLSIGATPRMVLLQFLIEATMLSLLGGLFGSLIALIAVASISSIYSLPFVFSIKVLILALLSSSFIGIFFGFNPAYKASKLNPIDALRYE